MKTEEKKQPTHTQGKWDYKSSSIQPIVITGKNGEAIATLGKDDYASAKRIVKCMNMHDELIEGIKYQLLQMQTVRGILLGAGTDESDDTIEHLSYGIKKAKQLLLKQAEQE